MQNKPEEEYREITKELAQSYVLKGYDIEYMLFDDQYWMGMYVEDWNWVNARYRIATNQL